MRQLALVLVFFSVGFVPMAQKLQVSANNLKVGYFDTIVYNPETTIVRNGQETAAPFWVGIWFPLAASDTAKNMCFGDYFCHSNDKDSALFHRTVELYKRSSLAVSFGYTLRADYFPDYKDPGGKQSKLFDLALTSPVSAIRQHVLPVNASFPCIVYHHGSGSHLFDNNEFCEFMASNGYVVISSSYNFVDESADRLKGYHIDDKNFAADIDFITRFASSLSIVDTSRMVLSGHSWGAQAALQYDHMYTHKPYKTILAFQTTLEEASLQDAPNWPYLSFIYQNACLNCTTPTYIFATHSARKSVVKNEEGKSEEKIWAVAPRYEPFRENKVTPYVFITSKTPQLHQHFVSLGHLRYSLVYDYNFKDAEQLTEQYRSYLELLILCRTICNDLFNQDDGLSLSEVAADNFIIENVNY